MRKFLFVVILGLTSCYDFDYVEPTEEMHYKKPVVASDSSYIEADTVKRRCGV